MRNHRWVGIALLSLMMVLGRRTLAAQPTVQLSPSRITLDEAATLRISADDGKASTPPTVAGLRFHPVGQSTEMSSINGAVSRHTWVDYQVVADHAGTYAIPINGQSVSLEVADSGSAAARVGARAAPPSADEGALAFLRVALPTHKVYVGQSVPITFKAYFRAGTEVTLTAAPSLGIPAFTVSQLSEQPRQSVETVSEVPYRVATWTGQVSAAMPGHYGSNATLPLIARYREAARPEADPFAGMLDDQDPFGSSSLLRSFMNRSAFSGDLFGQVRERELTLHAHAQPLEVVALPTAGRPADFRGAVGRFDVRASMASTSGATFEPMSLRLTVTGHGNFDRVTMSGVPATAEWKTYPPSGGATTNDAKSFEQAIVPLTAGHIDVPPVSFSFFDPDRGSYVTRSTAPIAVEVKQIAAGVASSVAPSPDVSPSKELRPNHVDAGAHVVTLAPAYRYPLFWAALSAPLLLLGLLSWRRNVSVSDEARRHAFDKHVAAQRAAMVGAVNTNDANAYFEAARSALQARLAERWNMAPDDVTAAEVETRGGGSLVVAVLRTAEQLRYSGLPPEVTSLAAYDASVERQLDQLEVRI